MNLLVVGRNIVAISVLAISAYPSNADSANLCLAGKYKCIRGDVGAQLKCHVNAEKDGTALDAGCIDRARAKFDGTLLAPPVPEKGCFEKVEAKQDPAVPETQCSFVDDTAAVAALIDPFIEDTVESLDPGYPAPIQNECAAKKKKCVLKLAASEIKCYEAGAKTGGLFYDSACMDKARGKFDGSLLFPPRPEKGCFERLEARLPGCLTTDDTQAVRDAVEAFVFDTLVCEFGRLADCRGLPSPTPPAPTATPTPP